jgi:hypothetical protein
MKILGPSFTLHITKRSIGQYTRPQSLSFEDPGKPRPRRLARFLAFMCHFPVQLGLTALLPDVLNS